MTDLNFFLIQRFNTQPRGGGCFILTKSKQPEKEFQHTAARRRLLMCHCIYSKQINCFNTQPRGGGCLVLSICGSLFWVSTHSRAEAAALWFFVQIFSAQFQHTAARRRLRCVPIIIRLKRLFQHTAARRRLLA